MPTDTLEDALFDLNTLLAEFLAFLPSLIVSIIVFFVFLYLAGLFGMMTRRALASRKNNPEVDNVIVKIVRSSMIVIGILVALQQVGFDVTAFLTGLGIMGFTIGFALQDVSKNFVAGLLLHVQDPFEIGDVIKVMDYTGKVETIDLRATKIRLLDGTEVLIPNADVFTNPIVNYSNALTRRLEISVGVAYDTDLEKARQMVLETISSIEGVLTEPTPDVVFEEFNSSSIDFTLYFWIDVNKIGYFVAQDTAITRIKAVFEQAEIEIPYPITTVLLPETGNMGAAN